MPKPKPAKGAVDEPAEVASPAVAPSKRPPPAADRHFRQTKRGPGQKIPWSEEETKALLEGVERWQVGKWSTIKDDPDFGPILAQRTTVDMKDKFRNLIAKQQREANPSLGAGASAASASASVKRIKTEGLLSPLQGKNTPRLKPKPPELALGDELGGNKQLVTIYDGRPRVRRAKEVAVQIVCTAKVQTLIELAAKEFGCDCPVSRLSLFSTLAGRIDPKSTVGSIAKFDRLRLEQAFEDDDV